MAGIRTAGGTVNTLRLPALVGVAAVVLEKGMAELAVSLAVVA